MIGVRGEVCTGTRLPIRGGANLGSSFWLAGSNERRDGPRNTDVQLRGGHGTGPLHRDGIHTGRCGRIPLPEQVVARVPRRTGSASQEPNVHRSPGSRSELAPRVPA